MYNGFGITGKDWNLPMTHKINKIIAREGLIVAALLSMFATLSLSDEAIESKEGVTAKKADSEKSYLQTRKIACPKCSQTIDVKIADSPDTVYVCKKCDHKFSKTAGIGAFKKLLLNVSDIQTLQDL